MAALVSRIAGVFVVVLPLLLLQTGCGGGGSIYDSNTFRSAIGDQTIPAQPQTSGSFFAGNGGSLFTQNNAPLALDRDGAPRISGSVLALIDIIGEVGNTGDQVGQVGEALFTGLRSASHDAGLRTLLGRVLKRLAVTTPEDTTGSISLLLAVTNEGIPQTTFDTRSCDGDASGGSNPFGGSYEIQTFSSNGSRSYFLSGNVITVNFHDCILDGTTLNGGLNISDFLFQDDPATEAYDPLMSGTVSFNGFSLGQDANLLSFATSSGTALSYSTRYQDVRPIASRINSGTLTISNADNKDDRLEDLEITIEFDDNNATYNLLAEGDIISSVSESRLSVTTLFPLHWQDNDSHPYSGSLHITDSGAASITLTALDRSLVQLEVDEDGDGVVDSSDTLAWSAVAP